MLEAFRVAARREPREVAKLVRLPLAKYLRLEQGSRKPTAAQVFALSLFFNGASWELLCQKTVPSSKRYKRHITKWHLRMAKSYHPKMFAGVRWPNPLVRFSEEALIPVDWTWFSEVPEHEREEIPPMRLREIHFRTGRVDRPWLGIRKDRVRFHRSRIDRLMREVV